MSNKAETARSNGALSKGPATEQGKAISAQNSLKHGLTSSRIVLPGESQEEFDALEASIIHRFKPVGELEMELAKEMAAARWRLRRIDIMETAVFKKALRQQQEILGPDTDPDEIRDAAYAEVAESKTLRMLSRHQGQLRRAYEKAWKEILLIQEDRQSEEEQNEPTMPGMTDELFDILTTPPGGFTPSRKYIAQQQANAAASGQELRS